MAKQLGGGTTLFAAATLATFAACDRAPADLAVGGPEFQKYGSPVGFVTSQPAQARTLVPQGSVDPHHLGG